MEHQEQFFTAHLKQHAKDYYPSLGEHTQVSLKSIQQRLSANLYHYTIGDGRQNHAVLIKERHGQEDPKYASSHYRRYIVDPNATFELEHRALSRIYELFHGMDDSRFGAIRVLDVLSEQQAVIMTESSAPDLRYFFLRKNRIQGLFQKIDLLPIFNNVGAWLKYFHEIESDDSIELCYHTRKEFIYSSEQFTQHLAEKVGNPAVFERLLLGISRYAKDVLEEEMPLGRRHGDFAMRNILIEGQEQIVVIDTLAKWQTAIYEDLGYFIARIWSNQIQVFSLGLAYSTSWIEACERSFLQGYFGREPIPSQVIALYKVLSLLDQWSAVAENLSQSSSAKNILRFNLMNRYFLRLVHTWMAELEQ